MYEIRWKQNHRGREKWHRITVKTFDELAVELVDALNNSTNNTAHITRKFNFTKELEKHE